MSLRGFHIFFIFFVSLFFALAAVWAFTGGMDTDARFWQPVGWLCAVTAAVVPAYGVYFINKAKKLGALAKEKAAQERDAIIGAFLQVQERAETKEDHI